MHRKHAKTLEQIFSHPLSMNIEWSEVKNLLEDCGADIETTAHNHIKVTLNNHTKTFKTFHKTLGDKHEIIELQHLLKDSGISAN